MALKTLNLENILFLDIETVPEYASYANLDERTAVLWESKTRYKRKPEISAEEFYDQAGIWAEFGKIICISVGYFNLRTGGREFRLKSYTGKEIELLTAFKSLLEKHFGKTADLLCAHNGKEFDFPYIARRMLIRQIALPHQLNLFGKKPWEVPFLDTLELWKFGDYKHYTSLNLLTHILGIPSPKDDIDGSQVRKVFYEDQDIDRIVRYCEKDVTALAQIILRLRQETLLENDEIVSV